VAGVTDVCFAHASEELFAGLLEERGISWQYEPHRFVTERTPEGQIVEEFVPDFYLPDLDLYVECTTMRSDLMSRKRRKARRAMEQYGISVMIVVLPPDLEEDAYGGLGRASPLVDSRLLDERFAVRSVVTGAFELLETPLTDVAVVRWG
jgi:hypothetical protein